jgi:endonuclease/exonuclease/phosphatase family metal-dependent hydrolase
MPYYKILNNKKAEDRRTAEGLIRLREALDNQTLLTAIPKKTVDETLLVASWNVREFGGTKYGGRESEPLFYIAEILSRFDLIAVQEVRDNLDALDQLINILGSWWKYLVSDVTLGAQGNQERHAFIYDTRKLSFGGLSGELIPPLKKQADGTLINDFGFARTPYLAGFRAGWFKFTICTQHLYYGESKADDPQRVKEAEWVTSLLKERMKSKDRWADHAILLGDFNVFSLKDKTFQALGKQDFTIPEALKGQYTNANLDKPFDQMAFAANEAKKKVEVLKAGVFPYFNHVYRLSEFALYGQEEKEFKQWRTYKMSDHLPIWAELAVDFGKPYLENKAKAPQ